MIYFYNSEVKISAQRSLKIGKITYKQRVVMAEESTKILQFKLNSCELLNNTR
ncbi:hypothetical protein [Campylobacter sp. MIT 21-1682]|uniref:hypothetical protein n=1 Tax=unclassified Campylobacter TaxID=2593542 RepID=UPI003A522A09